jgi:hypothetical protein
VIIYKVEICNIQRGGREGMGQQGPYLASAMWASRPEADVFGVNTTDKFMSHKKNEKTVWNTYSSRPVHGIKSDQHVRTKEKSHSIRGVPHRPNVTRRVRAEVEHAGGLGTEEGTVLCGARRVVGSVKVVLH